MGKRVSIMIDENLLVKLRLIQAKKIKNSGKAVSFSKVVCDTIRKDLKWIRLDMFLGKFVKEIRIKLVFRITQHLTSR